MSEICHRDRQNTPRRAGIKEYMDKMKHDEYELVEGEEFDRIQPRIEAELEEREWQE